MKSGKVIDVSKSSLVSLKAELLRKQEEAQKSKGSESFVRPVPKKKKELKINPGVEERREKDEISQEEVDLLKKSREVLEIKSKLYDKLNKGESVQENIGDPYLVDFKEKVDKVFGEDASTSKQTSEKVDEDASSHLSEDDDDDDDWVDYVDCLGRSRRCLKQDLKLIKEKDEEMSKMLGNRPLAEPSDEPSTLTDQPTERELEMISSDMQREMLRQKWEEQEQILLNKKNIYYEDIRFDEARTHGVAYYSFSTDENKREEEMAEFKLRREETINKRKEAKQAKDRRDMMKQSRLMAARQRQRARLGLPPLPTDIEMEEGKEELATEELDKEEEQSSQDLEASLTRAAHVRPWDVGKDGVKEKTKIMTQEEWIDKKRDERPEEFAPPSATEVAEISTTKKQKYKKRKGFTQHDSFDLKRKCEEKSDDDEMPGPWPEPNWNQAAGSFQSTSSNIEPPKQTSQTSFSKYKECASTSARGAAIPPPATFDYYNPSGSSSSKYSQRSKSTKEMIESIEAGLQFMKYQSEKRDELLRKKGED